MNRTIRIPLAIAAGSVSWALLWNAGTRGAAAVWPEHLASVETITHDGILLLYIAYGAALSTLAGFVTASAAGSAARVAVWGLAVLHLGLGIIAELSYWSLMPVWYHVVYLAQVVPATLFGGRLRVRQSGLSQAEKR